MAADSYGDLKIQKERCYGLVAGLPASSRPLVTKALKASERWHAGQVRGGTDFPYMTHVYHVVSVLVGEMKIRDPAVLAAGALHDVVEDCGVTVAELAERFGKRVARIVESESENTFGSRREYMEHFRSAPKGPLLVKTADRIDNLRFVEHEGITAFRVSRVAEEGKWPMEKVARYVIEAEKYILPHSKRASPEGFAELDRLVGRFKRDSSFAKTYGVLVAAGDTHFRD